MRTHTLFSCALAHKPRRHDVRSPHRRENLAARIDAGADLTIVEALGPTYYADAHLPGARNLPHDRVDELASDVLPNKHDFVVVYCANTPCPNSDVAARRLVELGYTNVHEYVEGKEDWAEAGLPLESDVPA